VRDLQLTYIIQRLDNINFYIERIVVNKIIPSKLMPRSIRASQVKIKEIRSAMQQGGWTQQALAQHLEISRTTLTVLLRGDAIARETFEELCKFLNLDWRDIRGEDVMKDDLETLVQEVRQKIAADVTERCGTMRVLDMTQPMDLERIYTEVNILKDVSSRQRIGYDEVMEVCSREHFDRFLVGTIQERMTGFAAVEEFQKLVVLGKLGAGKTTFMKYLAMSCLGGKFHGELVPIFVTLKVYAETRGALSLEEYIFAEMSRSDVSGDDVKRLLKEGRALILLDGLDEVHHKDDRRVKQDIDKFSRDWFRNKFVITCRIAAREYQFEKFTEVEVADFDDGQIETFVNNWFREKDEEKAARMLEKLRGNRPVKELATNPLLLTLLCLVFGDRNDFPPKRSELYKEGLEVLMKKWDAKRNIEREQIYKHLSPQNKEDMLGQIAFNTFVKGEYFFRQEDLQHQIKDYICNLPEASDDPEALRLDSEVVLKAIEHHHGLLVERARNIYSFSHLIFYEYFTAREIERKQQLEILVQNITNPRWKEVFYLTAEMLRQSDNLLRLMKAQLDKMLVGNEKLQSVLQWVIKKTESVKSTFKTSTVRLFYLDLSCVFDYCLLDHTYSLDIDLYLVYSLNRSLNLNRDLSQILTFNLDRLLFSDFTRSLNLANDIGDNVLQQVLQRLQDKLPDPKSDREIRSQWWTTNGEEWTRELRQVCIKHRNIGHDWQFTDEQKKLLKQYYNANLLLVECMNRSYVSKEVREEIEATLLLPREK